MHEGTDASTEVAGTSLMHQRSSFEMTLNGFLEDAVPSAFPFPRLRVLEVLGPPLPAKGARFDVGSGS